MINDEEIVSQMANCDNNKVENEKNQKSNSEKKNSEDHNAKLIDRKRRYLERRLSALQRDAFLVKEAKKDRIEKKRETLKSTNDTLTSVLNNMSEAMLIMIKLMQGQLLDFIKKCYQGKCLKNV